MDAVLALLAMLFFLFIAVVFGLTFLFGAKAIFDALTGRHSGDYPEGPGANSSLGDGF